MVEIEEYCFLLDEQYDSLNQKYKEAEISENKIKKENLSLKEDIRALMIENKTMRPNEEYKILIEKKYFLLNR